MCGGGSKPKAPKPAPDPRRKNAEYLAVAREIGIDPGKKNKLSDDQVFSVEREMQKRRDVKIEKQYEEQKAIATAPPPPAPAPVADVAASALGIAPRTAADGVPLAEESQASPAQARQGYGRRRFRTDMPMAGGSGGLSIPAV